jgi:hypothetical protein
MDDARLSDLEYRAEFERQQFDLYDSRRLAEETHANTVIAATLTVAAFVLADYSRSSHPGVVWLAVALVGLVWAMCLATLSRVVSWETSRHRGGAERSSDELARPIGSGPRSTRFDPPPQPPTRICGGS